MTNMGDTGLEPVTSCL